MRSSYRIRSVVAADAVTPAVRSFDGIRIGVHLKDLRPNVDGPGTVRALLGAVARLRADGLPAIAEVRMHHRCATSRLAKKCAVCVRRTRTRCSSNTGDSRMSNWRSR